MITNIIQHLGRVGGEVEAQIEKILEIFNKQLEDLKKKQMNNEMNMKCLVK